MPYITYEKEEQEEVKQYKIIVDKIPVYTNANNAKNHKKSVGTWGKGTYYVFNEAYGMINITTKVGTAGAWINPADNVIKEEPIEEEKPIETPIEEEKPVETPVEDTPTENAEKEPVTEEKPSEPTENTPNEGTSENEQPNEEIKQDNIFVKIIKIIIDFIIGIFKR